MVIIENLNSNQLVLLVAFLIAGQLGFSMVKELLEWLLTFLSWLINGSPFKVKTGE